MTEGFDTPEEAEEAFYAAFERGDLDAMMATWADDDNVICVHPGGSRLEGLDQIREAWRQVFAGGARLKFRITGRQSVTGSSVAVHNVFEHIKLVGDPRQVNPLVATNVFVRTPSGWRLWMHQAAPLPVAEDEAIEDSGSDDDGTDEDDVDTPRVLH